MSLTRAIRGLDRARLMALADALAVAVAVSLPWSTSATSILIAVWLVVTLPAIDLSLLRRQAGTAAGGLPLLLVALAVLGLTWADVGLRDRLDGLTPFVRFLAIPLLFAQFAVSKRGGRVLIGFLVSATALLAVSYVTALVPHLLWWRPPGIPVKDYIVQSGIFALCAVGLLDVALDQWMKQRRKPALAAALLAMVFLFNVLFVATGRTTLVALPVLLLLLGLRRVGWRGLCLGLAAGGALAAAAWALSPYLRARVISVPDEIARYAATGEETSAGQRLDWWRRSLTMIAEAPVLGYGTGSIREMFRRTSPDPKNEHATNPHNQIFAVGLQLGVGGIIVLLLMWFAHWRLFVTPGASAWVGLAVVAQNIVGSLFNSHLFDFTPGWIYVFGVGVVGGMVLSRSQAGA